MLINKFKKPFAQLQLLQFNFQLISLVTDL